MHPQTNLIFSYLLLCSSLLASLLLLRCLPRCCVSAARRVARLATAPRARRTWTGAAEVAYSAMEKGRALAGTWRGEELQRRHRDKPRQRYGDEPRRATAAARTGPADENYDDGFGQEVRSSHGCAGCWLCGSGQRKQLSFSLESNEEQVMDSCTSKFVLVDAADYDSSKDVPEDILATLEAISYHLQGRQWFLDGSTGNSIGSAPTQDPNGSTSTDDEAWNNWVIDHITTYYILSYGQCAKCRSK